MLRRTKSELLLLVGSVVLTGPLHSAAEPIRIHPESAHYFLWRGKPTVLITAGEHYGAVLNLDSI
jgi:hypothetical protein